MVDTLEIGDQAIPVVDLSYTDPGTGIDYTLPTKDTPGIVTNRYQVSVDVETDEPIYDYQVTFTPAVTTTEILPADPDDPESEDQILTFTESRLVFEASELGLDTGDDEPIIDVDAIQQTVNQAKQISSTALNTAIAVNSQVQNDESTPETYGRAEIDHVVDKMARNNADIQTRDITGLTDDELKEKAQENNITAELLSSDQQQLLEYIDNVFAQRDVLKSVRADMVDAQEQSQEQVQRGLEDDQANADAFQEQYLETAESQDSFLNPEGFTFPETERDDDLYPKLSEIATLMNSALLNSEDTVVPIVIEPEEDTSTSDPLPDFEPIIPPGVDEEDLPE